MQNKRGCGVVCLMNKLGSPTWGLPLFRTFTNEFLLQQLICLALQIIANLAINSANHQKLIEVDIADCLMQLILPSDEWFYTNHSTKYAKFVKHHAARVMVYLGLEKRLRNKVYLFDLMGLSFCFILSIDPIIESTYSPLEDLGLHSPPSESAEDSYIIHTSVSPNAIYSASCPKLLIGSSVEGILLDLIKQVEVRTLFFTLTVVHLLIFVKTLLIRHF